MFAPLLPQHAFCLVDLSRAFSLLHSKWVGRTGCDLKTRKRYLGVPSEKLNTARVISFQKLKFSEVNKLKMLCFPLFSVGRQAGR